MIDVKALARKLSSVEDIYWIAECIASAFYSGEKTGTELWNLIDLNALATAISQCKEGRLGLRCVEVIRSGNIAAAHELCQLLDYEKLVSDSANYDVDYGDCGW